MPSERVKLAWHAGLGLLALGALGYNVLASERFSDQRHRMNVWLYGFLVCIEGEHVLTHWRNR